MALSRYQVLPGLRAHQYTRHSLHADDRLWVEKNCYVDVVIELLHALGVEPLAAMGFCAAVDFEGDNFTFFKPQHEELREFFGVDFQEMNVWRPLIDHAREHLAAGKFLSTEADSFLLPDTAGTDYRRRHVKTTIIMADLDMAASRLGYFHNAGYYELAGEDFNSLFRMGVPADPAVLPLFAELVRIDRLVRRPPQELRDLARRRLVCHVARRPEANPIHRFEARFAKDLAALQSAGLDHYHAWAFATTRQLGASMELLAAHLNWLAGVGGDARMNRAAAEFMRVSEAAKLFILKAARAVAARKAPDASLSFGEMAVAWDRGMQDLAAAVS